VKLEIFNVLGQKVATLVNEMRAAGQYAVSWNGVDDNGKLASSGAYLLRLEAGSQVRLGRMALLK